MKNGMLFLFGIIIAAVLSGIFFVGHASGYSSGYTMGYQTAFQSAGVQTNTRTNAVVWNTTGLYEEMEDAQPQITIGRCIHVIVEDVAGDFYFVSVEENNTPIAYGWAQTKDIRLYPDFPNGVSCDL